MTLRGLLQGAFRRLLWVFDFLEFGLHGSGSRFRALCWGGGLGDVG